MPAVMYVARAGGQALGFLGADRRDRALPELLDARRVGPARQMSAARRQLGRREPRRVHRAAHENELRDVKIAASFGRAQNKLCRLPSLTLSAAPPAPLAAVLLPAIRLSPHSPPRVFLPLRPLTLCAATFAGSLFYLSYCFVSSTAAAHGGGKVERTKLVFRFREERCPIIHCVHTDIRHAHCTHAQNKKGERFVPLLISVHYRRDLITQSGLSCSALSPLLSAASHCWCARAATNIPLSAKGAVVITSFALAWVRRGHCGVTHADGTTMRYLHIKAGYGERLLRAPTARQYMLQRYLRIVD